MNKSFMVVAVAVLFFTPSAHSSSLQDVPVTVTTIQAGDIEAIRDVLDVAEITPGVHQVNIVPGPNGEITTRGNLGGLASGEVFINGQCGERCKFMPAEGVTDGRFLHLDGLSVAHLRSIEVVNYESSGNGGALLAQDQSRLYVENSMFENNIAGGDGGAMYVFDEAYASVKYSGFKFNSANFFGDHVAVNASPADLAHAFEGVGNFYYGSDGATAGENPNGVWESHSASMFHDGGINSVAGVWQFNVVYQPGQLDGEQLQQADGFPNKPEAQCNDFGTGAFGSSGYNISSDNSCNLDQATDLPSTDAMMALSGGVPVPMQGSPAIDSGPIEVLVVDDHPLATLPCGYKDNAGTARPQDANDDGVFECDRGAIEIPGKGEIVAGHSSVFFNPARNGEGNYVEVLADGRAVVYTFTYNTDGTGPAWFLGVGEATGNSIIIDDLFRPTGASFGDDFDAGDVEFTPAGSMSMVFPDCEATAPGGNIAFTGQPGLGYEGLITRATRLAHITGCGAETPSANAGLSGSFFDATRNGEGLIVEWLTNGDVLAVFFTYDTEGNQFWVFGQAAANGKSVTMDVIYPTAFTPWGRNYDAGDVSLDSWGTFTLTWTDCNTLTFEYDSTVGGFGSGTRNYTRLSKLAGTECPAFP